MTTQVSGKRWWLCLWPGLFQIWRRAEISGLSLAIVFAMLLNLAIATSLVWTELLPMPWRTAIWLTVTVFWLAAFVTSFRQATGMVARATHDLDLFSLANEEYLRGQLDEAREHLLLLVSRNPRDIEAGLLMATIDRRQGNYEQSMDRLRKLQRLEAAEPWRHELDDEWRRIRQQPPIHQQSQRDVDDESQTISRPADLCTGKASSSLLNESQPVT